ncbi:MAG: NAD-dependent epimerase/dehydratase family protein [Verrucomicrobia bacterium]|jgi:nucleoside-diphosphate-sugar epimerase|nr:NAD-dependent epimerase/dehydratase family protein [Verrucomicrobiota bacterium]
MKILVTGGGGFVGQAIIRRLLARGDSVRSFGRSPQPELTASGVDVVCGDLADAAVVRGAAQGVDAVFHVAAKAGVWGSWESYHRPNVIGTRNVLAACHAEGVKRLVHTSTPSVVFNRKPIQGGGPGMPYGRNWLCHYAHTKAIAEKEALAANSETLRVVALRPHLVFGPGDPHLLPRVLQSIQVGRLKIVGDGRNRVDVSYIEDVAAAHVSALEALVSDTCAGKAYFVSQGEPVQLWPWLNQILEGLGKPALTKRIPLPLAYVAGGVAEGIWKLTGKAGEPPITRFVAVELAKDHYFDIEPTYRDIGYRPEWTTDFALKATIEDLRIKGF